MQSSTVARKTASGPEAARTRSAHPRLCPRRHHQQRCTKERGQTRWAKPQACPRQHRARRAAGVARSLKRASFCGRRAQHGRTREGAPKAVAPGARAPRRYTRLAGQPHVLARAARAPPVVRGAAHGLSSAACRQACCTSMQGATEAHQRGLAAIVAQHDIARAFAEHLPLARNDVELGRHLCRRRTRLSV